MTTPRFFPTLPSRARRTVAGAAPLLLTLLLTLSACAPAARPTRPGPEFTRLEQAFRTLPPAQQVDELRLRPQPDGGTLVSGRLAGAAFTLRFPAHWNRQSVVFAHGYTLVETGPDAKPDTIPADPVANDETRGILAAAYGRGFAVGQSVYDKRGFAVESGIERTVALSRLLTALGAARAYIAGGSEGGSIVQLATERYPEQFAGALAACGVMGGWEKEMNFTTHVRALYNYFAAGSAYELPGRHDVTRTAQAGQNDILLTLLKLYAAAELNPRGDAARIIRLTVSAVPQVRTEGDIGTLGAALLTQMTGIEDFSAQVGGLFVDNSQTVYHSPLLTPEENATLNRGVQRYRADPQALAAVRERLAPSGHFRTRLLSVHNDYDPLVPAEHETWLREKVDAAGNGANLYQTLVPATYSRFPTKLLGFRAADHCGFSPDQSARAWDALQRWVETGVRPPADLR